MAGIETENVQKALKLRLKPTPEDILILEPFFRESKAATNFALKRIYQLRVGFEEVHPETGVCNWCKAETTLNYIKKDTEEKICPKCYNTKYGDYFIRKMFQPGGRTKRKLSHDMNIHLVAPNLPQIEFYQPIQQAIDMYKSITTLSFYYY